MYKIIFDNRNIKLLVATDLTYKECEELIARQLEPKYYYIVEM